MSENYTSNQAITNEESLNNFEKKPTNNNVLDDVYDLYGENNFNEFIEPELKIRENMTQKEIDNFNAKNAQHLLELSLCEDLIGIGNKKNTQPEIIRSEVVKSESITENKQIKVPENKQIKPSIQKQAKVPENKQTKSNSTQKKIHNKSYDEKYDEKYDEEYAEEYAEEYDEEYDDDYYYEEYDKLYK
jgi:hypothetical protein